MKKIVFLLVTAFVLSNAAPAVAMTVWCSNCSEKFVQYMERITNVEQLESLWKTYSENVQQTAQQIRLVQQTIEVYRNMVVNTISLPFSVVNAVKGDMMNMVKLINKLGTTIADLQTLDAIYTSSYPHWNGAKELTSPEQYQTKWEDWSKRVDDATQAAFQLSGAQLKAMEDDTPALEAHISNLLSSPAGRKQAIEAGNHLAAMQLQEARELRMLIGTHIQQCAVKDAKSEAKDKVTRAEILKFFKSYNVEMNAKTPDQSTSFR